MSHTLHIIASINSSKLALASTEDAQRLIEIFERATPVEQSYLLNGPHDWHTLDITGGNSLRIEMVNTTLMTEEEARERIESARAAREAAKKAIDTASTLTVTTITRPELAEGERYAGILLGKDGSPDMHIILMPGEAERITWKGAVAWAEQAGGSLPTLREQALLYANLKEQFEEAWYWSGEQHAGDADYAWCQNFRYGHQYWDDESYKLRARAVRRLVIE